MFAWPLAKLFAWFLVLLLVGTVFDVAILGNKTPPSRQSSAQSGAQAAVAQAIAAQAVSGSRVKRKPVE